MNWGTKLKLEGGKSFIGTEAWKVHEVYIKITYSQYEAIADIFTSIPLAV